jgi:prepilin signal peptidase PulO-like enzyme (type II secretory pathway)
MEEWQIYMLVFAIIQTLFVFALGACVGSLTNVLVYRMPLGLSVVTPPSRCPSCGTQLTWRENIPVLGWIFLGGKCRFCKSKISAEYPLVEAFVGVMYVVVYWVWFLLPPDWKIAGFTIHSMRPEWANEGLSAMWPMLTVVLVLFSALVAMTLVDAKTSMIPLPLAWTPTILAIIAHPLHAAWYAHSNGSLRRAADGWTWTLASPGSMGWPMIGAAMGGAVGVVLANIMLAKGLIRRSWSDYEAWEREHLLAAGIDPQTGDPLKPAESTVEAVPADGAVVPTEAVPAVPVEAGEGAVQAPVSAPVLEPATTPLVDVVQTGEASGETLAGAPAAAPANSAEAPQVASVPVQIEGDGSPSDLWLEYPHARREVLKEAVFLAPVILCALAGSWVARTYAGPWNFDAVEMASVPAKLAPLWLDALSGALMGYLVGALVVWVVRILGTLAFGREAMGMGDVHLLAAVGACVGWVDATLAFFGAAFVGITYAAITSFFKGFRRAMPYGPHIAVAAVLVVMFKPLLEKLLAMLLHSPVDLP